MRGLTVRQPYARLIEIGEKSIELRSWTTRYRGELLICAAARPDYDMGYPCGVTICRVSLVDIRPFLPEDARRACARWRPDLYAWLLENVRPIAQVPVKGRLGLFLLPRDLVARIDKAGQRSMPAAQL